MYAFVNFLYQFELRTWGIPERSSTFAVVWKSYLVVQHSSRKRARIYAMLLLCLSLFFIFIHWFSLLRKTKSGRSVNLTSFVLSSRSSRVDSCFDSECCSTKSFVLVANEKSLNELHANLSTSTCCWLQLKMHSNSDLIRQNLVTLDNNTTKRRQQQQLRLRLIAVNDDNVGSDAL